MRLIGLIVGFLYGLWIQAQDVKQPYVNEWENPLRYEWNKEKPHADFALYETAEDADKERKEEGFQETVPVLFLSRHD